jgi:hypothetical protein
LNGWDCVAGCHTVHEHVYIYVVIVGFVISMDGWLSYMYMW